MASRRRQRRHALSSRSRTPSSSASSTPTRRRLGPRQGARPPRRRTRPHSTTSAPGTRTPPTSRRAPRASETPTRRRRRKKKDAEAAKTGTVVPTNTTEPFIVERQPDGRPHDQPQPELQGPRSQAWDEPCRSRAATARLPDPDRRPGRGRAGPRLGGPRRARIARRKDDHPSHGQEAVHRGHDDRPRHGPGQGHLSRPQTRKEVIPGGSPMAGVRASRPYTPGLTRPGMGPIDRTKQLDELMLGGHDHLGAAAGDPQGRPRARLDDRLRVQHGATILREGVPDGGQPARPGHHERPAPRIPGHHPPAERARDDREVRAILGATPGDAGKLFRGLMAGQLAQATAYGGMKDSPASSWTRRSPRGRAERSGRGGRSRSCSWSACWWSANALGLGAIGAALPAPDTRASRCPIRPRPRSSQAAAAMAAQRRAVAAGAPGGVPTAGEPGAPPPAAGPVWQPPGAAPPGQGRLADPSWTIERPVQPSGG